jgi:electron transfer flavoprotein beta subunit
LHIITFTRSTPDTEARVEVGPDGAVTWGHAATIVNPWDEYAIEEAILQAEKAGGSTSVIAIGPDMHEEALKHCLAMGVQQALRIWDPELENADSLGYATAAAAAVNKLDAADLVIFGRESIDIGTDQHIYQTARKLGWPMLSYVARILAIDTEARTIQVERLLEQGRQVVTSKLPVVISVMKDINEPRYPSFIGIRKASRASIPVWSLADLGISLPPVRTQVVSYSNPPARTADVEMLSGTPEEQAAQLVERLLEEKVL